eukprot:TRINITY_DN50818_c0_g1_i1.p1 TRINITY_DN50818_c0_g1~~TRINITY_DN50818_c0_g1_i1.p1  ORF type:complete len:253 (+),score=50.78 TRINITY_DN50818_c0_g1_i1:37-759(+)
MDSLDTDKEDTLGASGEAGPEDAAFVNEDVERLVTRWRNEKYAPELLPFDTEVVEDMSEVLEFVADSLEEDRAEGEQDPNDPDFRLRSLDLDRMKYILRDYLRIRLWKLSQWPQHYLEPKNQSLLSAAERTFLNEYWENKKLYLENRLLSALPRNNQGLADKSDLLDMVRKPDLEKFVYVRIKADVGEIEVPPSLSGPTQESSGTQKPLPLDEGNTYLLRYCLVRPFLMEAAHNGKVELV